MNNLQLVWKNITHQLGSTLLSILLTAFGVAILCVIYITSDTFEKQLTNNTKNVDLVVGAKGSPLQLILSSLYHVDNPTGNIALEEARKLAQNPFIETAVPISLGDNFKGHRLIGTEPSYLDLYELSFKEGVIWNSAFEAVIGSEVARKRGLKIGDSFNTSHGLAAEGHVHDEHPFRVVGILQPSHSVVDNLILCNLESVWDVHGLAHEDHSAHTHDGDHHHEADVHTPDQHQIEHNHEHDHQQAQPIEEAQSSEELVQERPQEEQYVKNIGDDMLAYRGDEVTALLVKYASPAAMGIVPRLVNQSTDMQAASPAIESTRLFSLLGVGLDSLTVLAYIIMFIAGLSVFISLYNALKERKYDLAIMRSMGASQTKLFTLVIVEGIVITAIGGVIGMFLGHFALYIINIQTSESADFIQVFALNNKEIYLIAVACIIGVVAALIPAIRAYKTSISTILADK
ncbi:FtsX-like permease family protein [Sphingobacterium sp. LRF_L2]|uniref:ABC transporter permease n=1 Tax=Sphingobacterium sp. LRF_L2 TaxID=3369421 RepID=UPI003F640693